MKVRKVLSREGETEGQKQRHADRLEKRQGKKPYGLTERRIKPEISKTISGWD